MKNIFKFQNGMVHIIPLLVAVLVIPVMIWVFTSSNFNLLRKAASGDPTPTPIRVGAYNISLSNPVTRITCYIGDLNCYYRSTAIITNALSTSPLYDTTLYTSSNPAGSLKYTNQSGIYTADKTVIPGRVDPGKEAYNTNIQMFPPQQIGTYSGRFYVDGKTCNNNVTPPDCYYYGASYVDVSINVIGSTQPPLPTTTSAPIGCGKFTYPNCSIGTCQNGFFCRTVKVKGKYTCQCTK